MSIWKVGRDVVLENSLISGRKIWRKNCGHGQRRRDQLYGIKAKADCLATAFLRKGILKGDKVLVQLPNRISFVVVFCAFQDRGGADHDAAGPQGGGTGRNY